MIGNSSNLFQCIFIGIFLSLIALITTIGNLFVIFAFYYDQKLRTINDYFILNMAIADFFVGFFCIPFYIPFSIGNVWPFGKIFCQVWVTIDDVSTMASVINIVAITINRYWLIAHPISYRKYIKQRFVYSAMAFIWLISFLNFGPGIWLMNLLKPIEYSSGDCSGDYNHSFVYMLIAQLNYFMIPFVLLCLFNLLIMYNIWKRTKKISRFKSIQLNEEQKFSCEEKRKTMLIVSQQTTTNKRFSNDYSPVVLMKKSHEHSMKKSFKTNLTSSKENSSFRSIPQLLKSHENLRKPIEEKNRNIQMRDLRIKRDRKAARSLFILVFVFLIFLFPYVICATATTAGLTIPKPIFQFSFWLLWINSTFNPFLYPFIQIKYRNAYLNLFNSCFNK